MSATSKFSSADIPLPASFDIDGVSYDRFYSYLQNWGQTLQSWGVGYNFAQVALSGLGDPSQAGSGNPALDSALLTIANDLSAQNLAAGGDQTKLWRMRAVGGSYDQFHDVLVGFQIQKVGLVDTHCWLPLVGDNNLTLPVATDKGLPWCLDTWFRFAGRQDDTPKFCYVKLPSGAAAALLDLPADAPAELVGAGAKLAVVSTGSSMLEFSQALADQGFYLCVPTAPGVLSVGGVVAIGGHGSGVSSAASGRLGVPGYAFSSVSNQMLWMDTLAYDPGQKSYGFKRVSRADPATAAEWSAMACGLGKTFAVRMAFLVYPLARNQLKARVLQLNHFVAASTLMGSDGTAPGSLQYLVDNYGGFEPIQYPTYTDEFYAGGDFVWTKTWSYHPEGSDFADVSVFHKDAATGQTVASPLQPAWCGEVNAPYNYHWTATVPCPASTALIDTLIVNPALTPTITQGAAVITALPDSAGGGATGTPADNGRTALWSDTNLNVYYFVEPTTVRAYDWSYAVQCRRDQIQAVVNIFHTESLALFRAFQDQGKYPVMVAGEIRLVELDVSPSAAWSYPALSCPTPGLQPQGVDPAGMVCVYLSWLSAYAHPGYWDFCAQLEDRLFFGADAQYNGYAWAPEWSKGWACTGDGPYLSDTKLARIRANFNNGANTNAFTAATACLVASDPQNLFYSRIIGRIFGG